MKKNLIKKICVILISTLLVNNFTFAGEFVVEMGGIKYLDDNNEYIVGQWRWLDPDGNGIAECYRFDDNGFLLTNTVYNGKSINAAGCWEEDGVIKKMMLSSGKVFDDEGKNKDAQPIVDKIHHSLINATTLSDEQLMNKEEHHKKKATKSQVELKKATDTRDEFGRIIAKNTKLKKVPIATRSDGVTIYSFNPYSYATYASGSVIKPGKDMKNYITTSNNFVKEVDSANIWGGDVWKKCMCLKGNGAKVKFEAKNFNYFTIEVAHQKHGESTADTYCYIELYEDGVQTLIFDAFNDDEPEIIEEYLDDDVRTIELKLVVKGDALGRKVYLRDGRFRKIRERLDD